MSLKRFWYVLACSLLAVSFCSAAALIPGEFVVQPGKSRVWYFTHSGVSRLTGNFHVTGGTKNDIQAIVGEVGECENWLNGNQAHVLYASGPVTNGAVDITIRGDMKMCIAFSNGSAIISPKEVTADFNYTPLEVSPNSEMGRYKQSVIDFFNKQGKASPPPDACRNWLFDAECGGSPLNGVFIGAGLVFCGLVVSWILQGYRKTTILKP